jgi:hypothetical protein
LDGVCDAALTVRTKWCVGVDNCKLVANPEQTITVRGALIGDACNTGTSSFQCNNSGVQRRAPYRIVTLAVNNVHAGCSRRLPRGMRYWLRREGSRDCASAR